MNDFPLAPFFIALSADGISVTVRDYERVVCVLKTEDEWTLSRLKIVLISLLAHNGEQAEICRRRFESFFDKKLAIPEEITPAVLARALDELRSHDWASTARPKKTSQTKILPPGTEGPLMKITPDDQPPPVRGWRQALVNIRRIGQERFSVWHAAAAVLFLGLLIGIWQLLPKIDFAPLIVLPPIQNRASIQMPLPSAAAEKEPDTVKIENISDPERKPFTERTWYDVAGIFVLGGFPIILLSLLSALAAKGLKDQKPEFDPKAPRIFPLHQIGGRPKPRLGNAELDSLSDLLGYFLSANPGRCLNVNRSVLATIHNGGWPSLHFNWLKQVRRVFILEDAYAEPLAWNPVSSELAEGLGRRGIDVHYGKFYEGPDKFQMQDGTVEWLEDLEAARENSLLLFFSDGKRLNSARDQFTLEVLGRWKTVAWLDLREQDFWDEGAQLIKNHGIPLYEASAAGLDRALRRFLTEQNSQADDSEGRRHFRGLPAFINDRLDPYLESVLGDATAWAQACAMIQPVTIGLADALRERFAPSLPAERVERLFRLPGSTWNVSGLRFSLPVLAALRKGFTIRWETSEQEEILDFILDRVRKVEPPEKNSLRHFSWEWALERVRLEIDPDNALRNIARLAQSPLKIAIEDEFSNLGLPGEPASEKYPVPLRARPMTARGLLDFQNFADRTVSLPDLTLPERLAVERHRFIRTIKLGWRAGKHLLAQGAAAIRELVEPRKALKLNDGQPIFAEPSKLEFKNLRAGGEATQKIVFESHDERLVVGRVESNKDWITIKRKLANGRRRHSTDVKVSAKGLSTGNHESTILFVPDRGETLEIPVIVKVVRSWQEVFKDWWRENKPSRRLGFLLACLLIGLTALFVSERGLAHNWLNHLFNAPPELAERLKVELLGDQRSLQLTATGNDPKGDTSRLNYKWETDTGKLTQSGNTARLENIDLNSLPGKIRVKLILTDKDGGRSTFETTIALDKFATGNQDATTPGSTKPDSQTGKDNEDDPKDGGNPAASTKMVLIDLPEGMDSNDIPSKISSSKMPPPLKDKDFAYSLYLANQDGNRDFVFEYGEKVSIYLTGDGNNFIADLESRGYPVRINGSVVCSNLNSQETFVQETFKKDILVGVNSLLLYEFNAPASKSTGCVIHTNLYYQDKLVNSAATGFPIVKSSDSGDRAITPVVWLQKAGTNVQTGFFKPEDEIELGIRGFTAKPDRNDFLTSEELRDLVGKVDIDIGCHGNDNRPTIFFNKTVSGDAIVFDRPLMSFRLGGNFDGLLQKTASCFAELTVFNRVAGISKKYVSRFKVEASEKNCPAGMILTSDGVCVPDKPSPTPCPLIQITSDPRMVKAGETVNFTAAVSSGEYRESWSVSGGEIISGQGTRTIAVKINPEVVDVMATFSVEGLPEGCKQQYSKTIRLISENQPVKVIKDDNPAESVGPIIARIKVTVSVSKKGKVTDVEIEGRNPANSGQAKSRVEKNWKFSPATKNGVAVDGSIDVWVIFRETPSVTK